MLETAFVPLFSDSALDSLVLPISLSGLAATGNELAVFSLVGGGGGGGSGGGTD